MNDLSTVNAISDGRIMSKKSILLICMLSLGSSGIATAHPLDSSDIVYIDGLPCNSACQSYMAWSRQTQSITGKPVRTQPPATNAAARSAKGIETERPRPGKHDRATKQIVLVPREKPQANIVESPPADQAATNSVAPDAPADVSGRMIQEQVAATRVLAEHPTVATTDQAADKKESTIDASGRAQDTQSGNAETADVAQANTKAPADFTGATKDVQLATATALGEQVSVATMARAPDEKANATDASGRVEKTQPPDAEKTAVTLPGNTDSPVTVVLARTEIKSVSEPVNKDIAIDGKQATLPVTFSSPPAEIAKEDRISGDGKAFAWFSALRWILSFR